MSRVLSAACALLLLLSSPVLAQSNWYDDLVFKDKSFTFEFIRALGQAYDQGADLGECVQTARRVVEGDDLSWYKEWSATGDRLAGRARVYEGAGHTVSAREAYFRASNYYRLAGFYLHDPEHIELALDSSRKSRDCFRKAIASLPEVEPVLIPYEDTKLPGYFLKGAPGKAPTLIVHTGFDGTGEELYFGPGRAAQKRGYHCLIFEGPGQGAVVREQHLPFRYDWEKVVSPVVDYALTRPEVDGDRLALMGISMGGYLAPRAVAFEYRIKACVANGGVLDFGAAACGSLSSEEVAAIDSAPEQLNMGVRQAMKADTNTRWFFNNGMYTFGVDSPVAFLKQVKKYNLDGVAGQIRCQMLVIDSEADMFMKGQAERLYARLDCPRTFLKFTGDEAAQAHCQEGAQALSNEEIFNWLDGVMKE